MRNKSSFNIKHSAIILSAGKSERFGQPKFMLPLPNGKIFLENIIDSYLDFNCEQVIVVLNQLGIEKIEEKKYPRLWLVLIPLLRISIMATSAFFSHSLTHGPLNIFSL